MRYAASLIVGVVIGAALFYLMQHLVAPPKHATAGTTVEIRAPVALLGEQPAAHKKRIEHTKLPEQPKPAPKSPRPAAPKTPTVPVHLVPVKLSPPTQGATTRLPTLPQGTQRGTGVPGIETGVTDGAASPTLTIAPNYPPRAEREGIEGWVQVEFTVGVDGSVHDVQVVTSKPHGMFDAAAIRAVQRWEFKPAYANGHPVEQRFTQTISFKLDGAAQR